MTDELSYEEVISSILAPWFSQEPAEADVEAHSFREAAARAVVAALNTKADRGVIRVIVPDVAAVKAVKDYLAAFFEEKRLTKLLDRMTPDGALLASGLAIEVTANAVRLARGVITTISLVERQELPVDLDPRDVARAVCELVLEGPDASAMVEEVLGLEPGYFHAFQERHKQRMHERFAEMRAMVGTGATSEPTPVCDPAPTSVPTVRRRATIRSPFTVHWLPSPPWRE